MIAVALLLLGCGRDPVCSAPTDELAQAGHAVLTCHEVEWVVDYIGLLAARSVGRDRPRVLRAVIERFEDDPAATAAWLQQVRAAGWSLTAQGGLAGAEARAERVWAAQAGMDLIRPEDGDLYSVQKRAISVWSVSDDDKIALSEADIEAWIQYASLCREAQQGGVLRISVADRLSVYRMIRERFTAGPRAVRVALSAVGPYWGGVGDAWRVAPYERQQEWVQAAPLPPAMTATSLGYAGALFEGDLAKHAEVLHGALGPFMLGGRAPMFREEPLPH